MIINQTGINTRSHSTPGTSSLTVSNVQISIMAAVFRRLFTLVIFVSFSSFCFAQQDSLKQDTVKQKTHSPRKATIFSAVIPGLGQAYNRKYWKIPVVYAGIGACAYFAIKSNNRYTEFRDAWSDLNSTDPNGTIEFDGYLYTLNGLEQGKNYYRRNRDLFTIFTAGVYILNIIDANVDAHLFDFDISDDLTMRIQPVPINVTSTGTVSPGFSIKMTWR